MLNVPHAQRGQTLPMWVLSVLAAITLTFFVFNFANTVRWQVRAQNAADSAAVALVAKDAQAANSLTTLVYALDLQDFKISTINNAITNLLTNNAACLTQTVCSQSLTTLLTDYTKYAGTSSGGGISLITNEIESFMNGLGGKSIQNQLGLTGGSGGSTNLYLTNMLSSLLPPNGGSGVCVDVSTDCGFTYSVALVTTSPLVVDVVACRNVPTMLSTFMHLSSSTFKVVGRSTIELAPLDESQNVGSVLSSFGNANLHSSIPLGVGIDAINLANLSLTTGMLVPTPVSPLTSANVPC